MKKRIIVIVLLLAAILSIAIFLRIAGAQTIEGILGETKERGEMLGFGRSMIFGGLGISLAITVLAYTLATLLGFVVCFLKMSGNLFLRGLGGFYTTVLHGTPILILLLLAYYVIFAQSGIHSIIIASIVFGINASALIGELARSSILAIEKGQVEAARSMGFSNVSAFFTVTSPQAVRVSLPVYKSEFISMFKMTSLIGFLSIVDLIRQNRVSAEATVVPLIIIAVIYTLFSTVFINIFDLIGDATNKRLRRASK